jgi:hypothetical protein
MELRRKVIGVPLEKAVAADDGSLLVLGKFTSDNKDEVGDIITRSATERALPAYRRWGNIRRMHLPEPVGRVTRIGEADGLEWNEVEIKVIDPKAKFEVENGLLQALSVGILINFNDIDMMQDGGWVINDYQLAEISLVDHPANYDAALETLNLSADEGLRSQVREQGLVPVLRSIGAVLAQEGERMDKNATPVEPAADEVVEQPVESTAEDVVEAEVPEVPAAEEPVVEEQSVVEEPVAEVEQEQPVAEPALTDALAQLFNGLTDAITELGKKVDQLVGQQEEPAPVADVEGEAAKGIGGEDNDRVAQLEKQVAALSEELQLLKTPVDRSGALPVEEAPATEEEVQDTPEPVVRNLRDAVREYSKSRLARR